MKKKMVHEFNFKTTWKSVNLAHKLNITSTYGEPVGINHNLLFQRLTVLQQIVKPTYNTYLAWNFVHIQHLWEMHSANKPKGAMPLGLMLLGAMPLGDQMFQNLPEKL